MTAVDEQMEKGGEDAVKTRILSAARRHFLTHGFRAFTMDDLAAEMGMSKKTFYAHFASKRALLEAVIENKLATVDDDLARIAAQSCQDFMSAFRELLVCLRTHTEELQPPFLRDLGRETPELFERVQTRRRMFVQTHFGRLLDEGRKAGMIRQDFPQAVLIEILIGGMEALMNPQKLAELDLQPRKALSVLLTLFFEGALTEAGRKARPARPEDFS